MIELKLETIHALEEEIGKARNKFPNNKHLLAALMEEVGELAQALIKDLPVEDIRGEALQVACVAIRILEEGDSAFDKKDWDPVGKV